MVESQNLAEQETPDPSRPIQSEYVVDRRWHEVRPIRLAVATLALLGGQIFMAEIDSTETVTTKPDTAESKEILPTEPKTGLPLEPECGVDVKAPVASSVESGPANLWAGKWFSADSHVEKNVYEILRVTGVDARGFTYQFECRDTPYGPNAHWLDEARAFYGSSLQADDDANGRTFRLSIDPVDHHIRSIETQFREYEPVGCSVTGEGQDTKFVYQRTTFNAGFDCARATTPIEVSICGQELLSLGDLEMTKAYTLLRAASSAEDAKVLLDSQRAWLKQRNNACVNADGVVNDVCLARVYSNRLVELARLGDSALGDRPLLDAGYAMILLGRGADIRLDTAVRLAMYPMVVGTKQWRADGGGIMFESTCTDTRIVWPSDVEFRYSSMLFIGSEGTVWNARHIEPLADVRELNRYQLWSEAGGDPFMIRSDDGFESSDPAKISDEVPKLVQTWLIEHPITQSMRHVP